MSKIKPNSAQSATGREEPSLRGEVVKSNLALPATLSGTHLVVEKPVWNELAGQLRWRGANVLHLANQAHVERAIVREFNRLGWRWLIPDPIELADVGDATQERRHAIHHLNQHQVPT